MPFSTNLRRELILPWESPKIAQLADTRHTHKWRILEDFADNC